MEENCFFDFLGDVADREAVGLGVAALRPDADAVEVEVPSVGSGRSATRPEVAARTLTGISAITAIDVA